MILGGLHRALAGSVVQADVCVEDATEIKARGDEDEEEGQDQGELDEALAAAPRVEVAAERGAGAAQDRVHS